MLFALARKYFYVREDCNMTKEEATKKYYDLVEQCKIEDDDCEKYNMHHVNPIFTFKEKYNAKRTKEIRYDKNIDFGEEIKCSIPHHVELHFYLCFMFDKGTSLFKSAKSSFWFMTNKSLTQSIESLTEDDVKNIGKYCEELKKTNWTDEDKKNYRKTNKRIEADREYRRKNKEKLAKQHSEYYREHKEERMEYYEEWRSKNEPRLREYRKERNQIIRNRLCIDPRCIISNKIKSKITNWRNLSSWMDKNPQNELVKEFKSSNDFADYYLIKDENNNYVYDIELAESILKTTTNKKFLNILNFKIQGVKNPKDNNVRLCIDPRFGKTIIISKYKSINWNSEITEWRNLYNWYKRNSDNELIKNLKPNEFANKYLIIDSEGNYIYDEETALKTIHNNTIFEM